MDWNLESSLGYALALFVILMAIDMIRFGWRAIFRPNSKEADRLESVDRWMREPKPLFWLILAAIGFGVFIYLS